jgi:hypothetical protein
MWRSPVSATSQAGTTGHCTVTSRPALEEANMPVYDRTNIPTAVSRGKLDPELKAWLPTGPVLGADIDIAQGRRDHRQLGVGPWPAIGSVDTLVLPGRLRPGSG